MSSVKVIKCITHTALKLNITFSEVVNELLLSKDMKKIKVDITHERNRNEASDTFDRFSATSTGLRPGETVTGINKGSKGTIMNYRESPGQDPEDAIIPPRKKELDWLRQEPDLWGMFIERLGGIEFFADMSTIERENWLATYESEKDIDISEKGGQVEILDIGTGLFSEKLDATQMGKIMEEGWINALEVREMIPGKPGSNARRKTLIFLRSFWTIDAGNIVVKKFNGVVFDVNSGKVYKNGCKCGSDENIQLFNEESYGIRYNKKGVKLNYDNVMEVAHTYLETDDEEDEAGLLREATSGFTAAGYKSLIQKIVRYRPKVVRVPLPKGDTIDVDARSALIYSVALLFAHPGSFVPDIQRFVSGPESVAKRLVVTLYEDSYFPLCESNDVFSVVMGAFLFQRTKLFQPTQNFLMKCFGMADKMLNQERYFTYMGVRIGLLGEKSLTHYKVSEISPSNKDERKLQYISAFMDELKSFPIDLQMMRWVAENPHDKGQSPLTKKKMPFSTLR